MTQTLKKQEFPLSRRSNYKFDSYKIQQEFKPVILNFLFRNISFTNRKERIRAINPFEYEQMSKAIDIPIPLIHKALSKFLIDLVRFKSYLKKSTITHNLKSRSRKVQIYLHKVYRLAPVFNYKRARQNMNILKLKLEKLFFWPHVMTQVAIIIFATDLHDKYISKHIIQSNLRTLCSCSAYAFHRTRNKIDLNILASKIE